MFVGCAGDEGVPPAFAHACTALDCPGNPLSWKASCPFAATPAQLSARPTLAPTAWINPLQGQGLNEKQLALCDSFVYIPQYGPGTASLNVAVAASIVLHHFALFAGYPERQREVGVRGSEAGGQEKKGHVRLSPWGCWVPSVFLLHIIHPVPHRSSQGTACFLALQGYKFVVDERPQRTGPRGRVPLTPEQLAAERARRAAAAADGDRDASDLPPLFD